MGLLDKLFGKKQTVSPSFTESNNIGTRQSTIDQAVAYWNLRNVRQKFDPFVLFVFNTEDEARQALLELDCIHQARDSHNLICTKPLVYGSYRTEDGKYEAIIAGEKLSHDLWQETKAAFEKHGGRRKNDQEPEMQAAASSDKPVDFASKIKLIRKYTDQNRSGNPTYEDYECDDAETAKEFLLTKSVDQKLYYITVKTPMGVWGIDIKGLYKEHLLPWQNDIAAADVEGHTIGMADTFSLQMAARGSNDNFVVSIECGNCTHKWMDGVRYQNWTVVECPNCSKRNRVNSHNYTAVFV